MFSVWFKKLTGLTIVEGLIGVNFKCVKAMSPPFVLPSCHSSSSSPFFLVLFTFVCFLFDVTLLRPSS